MICIVALVVFGILSIFSASSRKLAREAFDCVFRKLTFRKCRTGLDQRLKSQVTGVIMRRNPRLGAGIYRHFSIISWLLTLLMLASIAGVGYGVTNYARYGNCNGPESDEFCIFDPGSDPAFSGAGNACLAEPEPWKNLKAPDVQGEYALGNLDSKVTFVEFMCYACQYSKKAAPVVSELYGKYKDEVKFVFLYFPILNHNGSWQDAQAAECAKQQDSFWEYHNLMFQNGPVMEQEQVVQLAGQLALDMDQFTACLNSTAARQVVERNHRMGTEAGVYGTPTFFVNNQSLVGPKSMKRFEKIIKEELEK